MIGSETIRATVERNLCNSCGTCMAICPSAAIQMQETPAGLLVANVNDDVCNHCGLCIRVCPGTHLEPRVLNEQVDPFKGQVLAAYCGYAVDSTVRKNAQSGGIVTALLRDMLKTGSIDKALVSQMPEDGSLRPYPYFAKTREELFQARGSKYCPIAVNTKLENVNESMAVVGLSCHMHGLENLEKIKRQYSENIKLRIGLFCDRTLTFGAIDYLVDKAGVDKDEVKDFRFREKKWRGAPGDVYITTHNGCEKNLDWKYRMQCKDVFTPARCRLCFDKMNIFSDIAVGDAWGISEGREGYSAIVVRTQRGLDALRSAERAGVIKLDQLSPEVIFDGQRVEDRRRNWVGYNTVWRENYGQVPEFGIDKQWYEHIKNKSLSNFKKQLNCAVRLANAKSSEMMLKSAKNRMFVTTIKRFVSPILFAKRILRRLQ